MSIKDTLIQKASGKVKHLFRHILNVSYVIGSFCLGWCSYDKMRAYIHEYFRTRRKHKLRAQGKAFNIETYNGKRIHNLEEANKIIGDAIEAGRPFMAGRYGSTELNAMWRVRDDGRGFIAPMKRAVYSMWHASGFFPKDKKLLIKFADLMKWATSQVDLMGVWFNPMEEYELRTYSSNPEYTRLGFLEPWFADNPWTEKLEGKKVLVIHPFYKTIPAQYAKRELLFPGKNILPKFDLIMQRAVQTIVGTKDERFSDWFEALEYMYNEAMTHDFDVAIIGCGAYGFPLAAKLKQAGKIAVHLGGATQLLFGIKGARWDSYGGRWAEMLNNPAWVRPLDEEKPEGFKKVEGGCYW